MIPARRMSPYLEHPEFLLQLPNVFSSFIPYLRNKSQTVPDYRPTCDKAIGFIGASNSNAESDMKDKWPYFHRPLRGISNCIIAGRTLYLKSLRFLHTQRNRPNKPCFHWSPRSNLPPRRV